MKLVNELAPFAVVAVILLLVFAGKNAKGKSTQTRTATGDLSRRQPLTEREQSMYFRLRDTFPESVVLAQVAFSAILDTRDRPTRATFDRKVADFVVCSKAFEVLAVIELDDASHRGNEAKDDKRDAMLEKAGHRVLRFKNIPDRAALIAAMKPVSADFSATS